MSPELDQLVSDVVDLTGVAKPVWLEDDAPVLSDDAGNGADGFYLVGLIGGKDVGKSALVNALVGHEITMQTSHGPGTETVIAYAHASQAEALRSLLEREVPGRYRIVEHRSAELRRQVLLDLPDVDSHWGDHLVVTRKMLRHMLFPVWMQSVEKYADRQPQELLAKVAAGNAPANFVFCLNKVDQVERASGGSSSAIAELQEDYAARLKRVLALDQPPRVWTICAVRPDRFELPALRAMLTQQKSDEAVRESKAKAALRQKSSVLAWLNEQDLPARAERLKRLEDEAEEFVNERLGGPLLDGLLPRLTDDPLYRQGVTDECLAKRTARWPIVNVLHAPFSALAGFFRRNAEAQPRPLTVPTGEALVDQQLLALASTPVGNSPGRTLAERVQTAFALLQQSYPAVSALYKDCKLWEAIPAATAAGELRESLVGTVDRQRTAACARLDDRGGGPWGLVRVLLTIGALIWFPLLQPLVEAVVANMATSQPSTQQRSVAVVLVQVVSINNLLSAMMFLIAWFALLWLVLRWDAQRRVTRQFARWKRLEQEDPTLSLAGRTLEWLDGLTAPIRAARERAEGLASKVQELQATVERGA
jgi:hypothetical protein